MSASIEEQLEDALSYQAKLESCLTIVEDKAGLLQEIRDTEDTLQRLVYESLQLYVQAPKRPLPPTAVTLLGLAFRDVVSGERSPLFEPKKKRSGDRSSPLQDQIYRGIAIAYIELARTGVIDDRTFLKTVREAYDVDGSTLPNWEKDAEARRYAEAFVGDLDQLDTVDTSLANQIKILMKHSGKKFQFRRRRRQWP